MRSDAEVRDPATAWRPTQFDLVLAGVVLVAQVGITVLAASHQSDRDSVDALGVLLLAAGPIALVWRRRFPVSVLMVTLATTLAYWVIGYGRGPIFFALIVAFVTVVNAGQRAIAWGSLVVGYVAFLWLPDAFDTSAPPSWAAALGLGAWLLVLGDRCRDRAGAS